MIILLAIKKMGQTQSNYIAIDFIDKVSGDFQRKEYNTDDPETIIRELALLRDKILDNEIELLLKVNRSADANTSYVEKYRAMSKLIRENKEIDLKGLVIVDFKVEGTTGDIVRNRTMLIILANFLHEQGILFSYKHEPVIDTDVWDVTPNYFKLLINYGLAGIKERKKKLLE